MHDPTSHPTLPRSAGNIRNWRREDVLDFEFLLARDQDFPVAELESRDHSIAREFFAAQTDGTPGRRPLFRFWLDHRRRQLPVDSLPGPMAAAGWRVFLKLLAVIALSLGSLTAVQLLHYDGVEPVNVAAYLGWLVLVQIALVVSAFVVLLLRRVGFLSTETALFTGLIRWGWSALAIRMNRQVLNRIPAERRGAIESFLGRAGALNQSHGTLAVWPLVGALQWFGVCFNLAAIITSVALILFSDRAFGWQSAVNVSPEQIHQLTQTLALPWSKVVPSAAAPTLEQIAGSKIYLKDGIRQLTTENLVAWWLFLIAAVTVYGLLPRMALGLIALGLGRRALSRLDFNHVACDRLYERLVSARMQTQAINAEPPRTDEAGTSPKKSSEVARESRETISLSAAVVLVSEEIGSQLDRAKIEELLRGRFLLQTEALLDWSETTTFRQRALNELQSRTWLEDRPVVLLIEEAWQPPIAEKLDGLRDLRRALGPRAKLLVALLGRPVGSNLLTPVRPADFAVWRDRLATLGDPQLRLEALVADE